MICPGTERQAQGGVGAQVECGEVHCLPESDTVMFAPHYHLPCTLTAYREMFLCLGGWPAPDAGRGDCSHVRAVSIHDPTGRIRGAPEETFSQPGAPREDTDCSAVNHR